jgi:YfiH family protein
MNIDGLIIGVSTVMDGNMSVKWGDEVKVIGNRKRFLKKLGLKYEDCVLASLLGGVELNVVGEKDKNKYIEGDALITKEKGVGVFMVTADCLPVVMFDPTKKILALVHLGWKGVDGKLAIKVIKRLRDLGSRPEDIRVWVGPGVRKGTYKKWEKGWDEFVQIIGENKKEWEDFIEDTDDGKKTLDLAGYVLKQLRDSGVTYVEVSPIDTFTDKNYFSHHRAFFTKEPEGRFATVAMMKSG